MGSTESKFAGSSTNFADVPFVNTANYAYITMRKTTEYWQNYKWFGQNSPHVVIVNSNNLRNGNNYARENVSMSRKSSTTQLKPIQKSGDILTESFIVNKSEPGEKYDLLSRKPSVKEFQFGDSDCSQEEAIMLDRCWVLANQLTSVNPVKAKLNVKTTQIDFNVEIENGNVSLCIDGNDQMYDSNGNEKTAKIEIAPTKDGCIEKRLFAVKEELDGLKNNSFNGNTVLDNYLEDVKEHHNKTLSFGLEDETCVYYKPSPVTSESDCENNVEENEKERKNRLEFLKDQLMFTLKGSEYESGEGDVVEICAKIEEEISLSRRALSVVSENFEDANSGKI